MIKTNDKHKRSISIRLDEKGDQMVNELQSKLLLSVSDVFRLALVRFYDDEFKR